MPDLSFLAAYAEHNAPMGVIMLVAMFLYKGVCSAASWLANRKKDNNCGKDLQCKHENLLNTILGRLDKDAQDREKRIKEVDQSLAKMDSSIVNLLDIVSDIEELQEKTSQGTLENMLFNDNPKLSVFKRLKAFKRLIGMKKNGRIKEKGFKLILENPGAWLDVQDTELPHLKIVDQKYFDDIMAAADRSIFDWGNK